MGSVLNGIHGQDMIDNIRIHCFRSQAADLKALRIVELGWDVFLDHLHGGMTAQNFTAVINRRVLSPVSGHVHDYSK